jgi:WD40 repeat protein
MASATLEWIGHDERVNCGVYSPNGCYIATGPDDETFRIWDTETGSAFGKPLESH